MEALEAIRPLGFTEYEGKAYLALLREAPMTGYAVAKQSGVPRAKIYEVLDALVSRGDVLMSDGDTPRYRALPIDALIERRRLQQDEALTNAENTLKRYAAPTDDDQDIWNLTGAEAILARARDVIRHSCGRILMEIWAEDFALLSDALMDAAQRGVRVMMIAYGDMKADWAEVYRHDRDDEIAREYGGRWLILSADDREVIAGTTTPEAHCRAAWSRHPGLVMPITEVVIHDLYVWEMLDKHGDILEETFGEHLSKLRDKFPTYRGDMT